jgi:hypothetical protein
MSIFVNATSYICYRQLVQQDNEINENKSAYNMTKKEHVIISTGAMIGGWLLFGFAMTTTLGYPVSTISIIVGLGFAVGGFISLVLALKRPTVRNK